MLETIDESLPESGIRQTLDGSPLIKRKPRHEQAEQVYDRAAADDLLYESSVTVSSIAPGAARQVRGNSYYEEEKRENQVGGCPPVPRSMLQGRINRAPRPRVVHENHPRDSEPTEHVERDKPLSGHSGRCNG